MWSGVSEEAKHLIKSLMQFDPEVIYCSTDNSEDVMLVTCDM